MAQKNGEREPVPLDQMVLSIVWEMEALYNILDKKGLVSKKELLAEVKRLAKEKEK
ncbi:MAG: hypothetical protein HY202_06900 [Nitrospirae bacterium]|nr:hypothetical protein [Nitrospirota bacterium]